MKIGSLLRRIPLKSRLASIAATRPQVVARHGHQTRNCSGGWHLLQILIRGLFRAPASRRPLADNARRTMEAAGLHAAPEFGTLATSPGPLSVEPRQIRIQRAEPDPEDVGPVTSNYLAHQSAAIARQADDLLYRNAVLDECHDGGV